tara:strand:- start:1908 stop:2138 length:231 start_codon:yes stop_codon:yes gene_type:complete
MTETLIIYISATASFLFLAVGVIAGWTANEVKHDMLYARETENEILHPEMYDQQGQWINEELLSVRFVNEDEIEEE